MRDKIAVLGLWIFVLILIVGCESPGPKSENIKRSAAVESDFPTFLVGTWESEKGRWSFTFEPDGSISHFRHGGGMEINVADGGVVEQWHEDIEAVFPLGLCETEYDSLSRELKVTIIIEDYIITFLNATMEGSFRDYFSGQVSQDGTQWNAMWTSTGEVFGRSSDGPNSVTVKPLVFKKVSSTE